MAGSRPGSARPFPATPAGPKGRQKKDDTVFSEVGSRQGDKRDDALRGELEAKDDDVELRSMERR